MHYGIVEISSMIGGDLLQKEDTVVTNVCIDTRQVASASQSLFFCLTSRNNGHRFIEPAYKKGIRNFVISEKVDTSALPGANFISVDDTLAALQLLAKKHRERFNATVIGITGSNGKTIVKEWLYQLLSPEKNIVKSPKSYNSQIGVPISVLNLDEKNELAIFEAGISTTGEMANLEAIIKPGIGIFTNVGSSHDAGFDSRQQKADEKLLLFRDAEKIIYCSDYKEITSAAWYIENRSRFISFGRDDASTLRIAGQRQEGNQSVFEIRSGAFNIEPAIFTIPFADPASIENCFHCVMTMLLLQYPLPVIQERILTLRNLPMRLELKYGINNCTIIDDSYSADFHSLQVAVDFFRHQETHKKKTLIISEFEGSGLEEKEFISKLRHVLEENKFDKLIGVGKTFMHHVESLAYTVKEWYVFETTEALIQQFSVLQFENELILLKGARRFGFERITGLLIGQTHATVLEINLNALTANLNTYKSYLSKDCGVIAMVKAFSYGSGSVEVASLLEKQRIDYLAVAYADEGVVLRKNNIATPIMVMNPDAIDFERMALYNLEPEIYSLYILRQLIQFLAANGSRTINIHIKLETGMNRLGFNADEMEDLLALLRENSTIIVKSVFSHLAASEDKTLDSFTLEQVDAFNLLSGKIISGLNYPVKKHLLNSSGIIRFPQAHFDYVRLGIGLYGVDSTDSIQQQLQPIGTLKTRIAQIKYVKQGETVGYSRKGVVEKDSKIAVLAIGYADGYDRRFGNGVGEVFISGQKAPVIGNICMDMCMADITHIEEVYEGDEAEIYGKEISIIQQAGKIGTIAYELLTRISSRVKRLYYLD